MELGTPLPSGAWASPPPPPFRHRGAASQPGGGGRGCHPAHLFLPWHTDCRPGEGPMPPASPSGCLGPGTLTRPLGNETGKCTKGRVAQKEGNETPPECTSVCFAEHLFLDQIRTRHGLWLQQAEMWRPHSQQGGGDVLLGAAVAGKQQEPSRRPHVPKGRIMGSAVPSTEEAGLRFRGGRGELGPLRIAVARSWPAPSPSEHDHV